MVIRTVKAASELTSDYEVIVVNDGSADSTPQIVDELARTYSHVRVVHHPKNRGYGGALQTGFRSATKEFIFYTDGDAQYDPAEIADQPLRSVPSHRHRAHLPSHRQPAVRPDGARRGLRLPADAPGDFREDRSRKDQWRDLPGDDEED
jgi:glycosyltransferase involved in cell wall biosynthesis